MPYGIEACALALLRADPRIAVPISRLHQALGQTADRPECSSIPLQTRLRERSDLFLLLEPRPAPWDADEWPEDTRRDYQSALRSAGLEPELRIAPRMAGYIVGESSGVDALILQLNNSLVDLWDAIDDDPDTRGQVAEALGLSDLLRHALDRINLPGTDHPTTPPPDPR